MHRCRLQHTGYRRTYAASKLRLRIPFASAHTCHNQIYCTKAINPKAGSSTNCLPVPRRAALIETTTAAAARGGASYRNGTDKRADIHRWQSLRLSDSEAVKYQQQSCPSQSVTQQRASNVCSGSAWRRPQRALQQTVRVLLMFLIICGQLKPPPPGGVASPARRCTAGLLACPPSLADATSVLTKSATAGELPGPPVGLYKRRLLLLVLRLVSFCCCCKCSWPPTTPLSAVACGGGAPALVDGAGDREQRP